MGTVLVTRIETWPLHRGRNGFGIKGILPIVAHCEPDNYLHRVQNLNPEIRKTKVSILTESTSGVSFVGEW